ncbi:glycosyltransferase family 39 protein [Rhodobacter sp. Har01]|uniref:ArnT family glycosyltransferase n=1 Tax=Rhodobacter sp. Har01 TaxID=2883999 RepID=UPI001D073F70|nr:glycosyltransferase family 39 protein [Rhodobacter sp. Har01]MCB6180050.1 glycosyltransferase family 39 protein [Rhodobacter sp. Har01]
MTGGTARTAGWLAPVLGLVVAVVALRWAALAFDRTDLFVDEAQYWLWGQHFDWGYFSKPPMIGWLIGAVTGLAGSDAPFWVRMPAAALHGVTAVLLAALSVRYFGTRAALWTAAAYLSLPLVAVGSFLISTDTVMMPFFAAALLAHARLCEGGRNADAVLAGALAGLGFLAKYAALYFPLGVVLAALLFPAARIPLRQAALMAAAFLVAAAPNLVWNAANGLATLTHTAGNIGWVQPGAKAALPGLAGLARFLADQAGVAGPVVFVALLAALVRLRRHGPLAAFALVPLAAVAVQSVLDQANANWTATAYLSGTPLALAVLAGWPRLRALGLALNAALCLALVGLTLAPETRFGRDAPVLARYLGRAALSHELLALSQAQGGVPIHARDRDVLADLFYTGRDSGIAIYAARPAGAPLHHYEQRYPLPEGIAGPVLAVLPAAPPCPVLAPPVPVGRGPGAYAGRGLSAWLVEGDCLAQTR